MKKEIIVSLSVLLIASVAASAQMYRWTADDGSVVYSEKPPLDDRDTTVVAKPPPPASKSPSELKAEKMAQDTARHKGNPALDKELQKKYCEDSRSNLALLKNNKPGDKYKTANGEEVSSTEEQLSIMIRYSEAAEKAYCDG